ncbi:hypothetical protein C0J52_04126 [Blattella germanica]|nr:hypothetical protein C0J52_04126 [Blattella germanica]
MRLREERGEAERALALDHKVRDLSSHNGEYNKYFQLFINNNFSASTYRYILYGGRCKHYTQ